MMVKDRLGLVAPVLAAAILGSFASTTFGAVEALRVVTYNIAADVDGVTTADPNVATVLEAIGATKIAGSTNTVDIIGLEETTSNAKTVDPILTSLNSYYGAGTYADTTGTFQASQSGSASTGNGPNAIIYNTTSVQLIASIGVGTPKGATNGEYRQVARYEFRPIGGTAANDFYVYVVHSKSSGSDDPDTDDQASRALEATIIRTDEASLPSNASVILMGDFNLDGSTEAAYKTMIASGIVDPVNPTGETATANFKSNSLYTNYLSDSSSKLSYRDDIQFMSTNVYNNTGALKYIAGSYEVFGNTAGKVTAVGSITTTMLSDATDHLPVVADYTISITFNATVPEPASLALLGLGSVALIRRRNHQT